MTQEYYSGVSARQQTRSLDQKDRELEQRDRSLDVDNYNAISGRINAQTGQFQAQTSSYLASIQDAAQREAARHNLITEQLIPSQIVQNYGSAIGRNSRLVAGAATALIGSGVARSVRDMGISGLASRVGKVAKIATPIAGAAALTGILYNARKDVPLEIMSGKRIPEEVD